MEAISLSWRKSSYSGNGGGNCVEVAPALRAPSLSVTPRTRAARSSPSPRHLAGACCRGEAGRHDLA